MTHVTHPLIRPDLLEERSYQIAIALSALERNTMVVLPTGLGKTAVALLIAASRLKNTGGKILMLAPTKPLVEQHWQYFSRYIIDPDDKNGVSGCVMFTGETRIEERTRLWNEGRCIFATPQVVKNDSLAGRYHISDASLLVIDECHRAVGNYAYVYIARHYFETAGDGGRILALTASPGSTPEKMQNICENLYIQAVETRSEDDPDVRPYIHERDLRHISVELPPELKNALSLLTRLLSSRLAHLSTFGYQVPPVERLTQKALSALNAQIQTKIRTNDSTAYTAASLYAECMKLRHAISLAGTQGSEALRIYCTRLQEEGKAGEKSSRASRRLASDPLFTKLMEECAKWTGEMHPKQKCIISIVKKQLHSHPESRIIIFATYRDTVQLLVEHLRSQGIDCRRFVGQASRDSEKGLSQKEQLKTLSGFREGEYRVLVATSVGEEGLDVPSTDLVIFYEAVPSEIRSIQRKGRTGRHGSGSIIVLVAKGTADEVYSHVSRSREKSMKKELLSMGGARPATERTDSAQTRIEAFTEDKGPRIIADDRETSSGVVEKLQEAGASIEVRRLDAGDYAIKNRILVERKTAADFADSLIERDLMGQIARMAALVPRPSLIIEGEQLYTQRNIHPNAIRGALVSIAMDMGVSIFFTETPAETAELLYVMARREESTPGTPTLHTKKSYRSIAEQQEYIISAFPGVGLKHARLLLAHFGSIKDVICADESEMMKIAGIGKKIAGSIADLASRKRE